MFAITKYPALFWFATLVNVININHDSFNSEKVQKI